MAKEIGVGELLFRLAEIGDEAGVRQALASGANPNDTDADLWTPGIFAARAGHAAVIRLLLSAGWNCSRRTLENWAAGTYAALDGHVEALTVLLEAGWNPGTPDSIGQTAGHLAALAGRADVIRTLAKSSLDWGVLDNSGASAGYFAAAHGHETALGAILDAGWNPNEIRKGPGRKPMLYPGHAAATLGETKSLAILLDAGWNPGAKDDLGRSAGYLAARAGQLESVRILLGRGWRPDEDAPRWLALHGAAAAGEAGCLQELLLMGSDMEKADLKGKLAIDMAVESGHWECEKLLLAERSIAEGERIRAQTGWEVGAMKAKKKKSL